MVSALFNSCVMQEALIRGIAQSLIFMQDLNVSDLLMNGGPGWHSYYYAYQFSAYGYDDTGNEITFGHLLDDTDFYGSRGRSGWSSNNRGWASPGTRG